MNELTHINQELVRNSTEKRKILRGYHAWLKSVRIKDRKTVQNNHDRVRYKLGRIKFPVLLHIKRMMLYSCYECLEIKTCLRSTGEVEINVYYYELNKGNKIE